MEITKMIQDQFECAMLMLEEAICKCPESLWNNDQYTNRFWHIAFHSLYYTHLYLQESQQSITPWVKYRTHYQYLGPLPWRKQELPVIADAYTPGELLEYLALCKNEIIQKVPHLQWEAESGFAWIPFNKLGLQIYNIRHLQHHTGQLIDRLRSRENIEVHWIIKSPAAAT